MSLLPKVQNVLSDLVLNRKTFTAFNVTEELRINNPSEKIWHYEVKEMVHDEMDEFVLDGTYSKKQDFSKHVDGPFVYEYAKTLMPTYTKNSPTQKSYTVDKRGRLFISKRMFDQTKLPTVVNIGKGDKSNTISILYGPLNMDESYDLVRDSYGGLKISKKILNQFGIDITKEIFISIAHYSLNGDVIVISN